FIFNTQLLMIGIDSTWHLVLTVASATVAMLVFAAATQGYFMVRSRWYESIVLLLVTFTLFRPGFWWDMVYPPFERHPANELTELIAKAPADARQRIWIEGINLDGKEIKKGVLLPLGAEGTAPERLKRVGLQLMPLGDKMQVAVVQFGSTAEKLGIEQGFDITQVEVAADRPDKEWMFVPAMGVLALIVMMQRARRRREPPAPVAKPA
ncbi:MAG: DUF3394 domain-containing protein, partial [Rhodoferax sp.]|nr:DUF3394 domain-containing protein [Rhodoferax sp.]